MIQEFVEAELERNHQKLIDIVNNVGGNWQVNEKSVNQIRYRFANRRQVQEIIQAIPHNKLHPDFYDDLLNATHPVVNRIMNTPLNEEPFILYLHTPNETQRNRLVYDNVRTPFDVLGAIHTFYVDRAGGDPRQIYDLIGTDNIFDMITEFNDGYRILLGG